MMTFIADRASKKLMNKWVSTGADTQPKPTHDVAKGKAGGRRREQEEVSTYGSCFVRRFDMLTLFFIAGEPRWARISAIGTRK